MIVVYGFLLLLLIEELVVLTINRIINGPFKWETTIKKLFIYYKNKFKKETKAA
ncbi:MAG: hypothetical protein ABF649_10310 [Bacillus sp. (in: firmicutes)]